MDEILVSLPLSDVRALIGAASPDAALLCLYLRAGGDAAAAAANLRMSQGRVDCALASLRQMGLWEEPKPRAVRAEPPVYTEQDVAREMERGSEFGMLVGEAQRRLGRILSTEELKVLLSLTDYLGLPSEVIGILITYCIQRSRARGAARSPSMHAIEKEAYRWADEGIDTLEEAAAHMQSLLDRQTRAARVRRALQLGDRKLTPGEEKYVLSWLDMGFGEAEIQMAYEKTCLNTGGLKWAYCNSILRSWDEQGLHSADAILAGDRQKQRREKVPAGSAGQGELGELEKLALEKMRREYGKEG